jgi:hypothetical protein
VQKTAVCGSEGIVYLVFKKEKRGVGRGREAQNLDFSHKKTPETRKRLWL